MVIQPTLLENILIVVGSGGWVFSSAAQLHKLYKTHNTHGLSAVNQTLNAAGNVGWCTYFAINHLWFAFACDIIVMTLTILTLAYTLSNKKQFARGLVAIATLG